MLSKVTNNKNGTGREQKDEHDVFRLIAVIDVDVLLMKDSHSPQG
jgi:hypothetical protein